MNDLISIIVPVYNCEKYLSKCIESILAQSYSNLELILINDGSTDNSLEICNRYKSMDNRITIINQDNKGVSAARNAGLSVAKGEYIGFVDSDDFIEEQMYEQMLMEINLKKADICVLSEYTIKKKNFDMINKTYVDRETAISSLFLLQFPTSLWCYLYSRKVINNEFLNENIDFFEDLEFNFRVLKKAFKISLCNEKLYYYRDNPESINSQFLNEKKMSGLKLINILDINNINIYQEYTIAHIVYSLIISATKNKYINKYFIDQILQFIKTHKKNIFFNRYVDLKYKVIVICFILSPFSLCRIIYNFRKLLKLMKYSKM